MPSASERAREREERNTEASEGRAKKGKVMTNARYENIALNGIYSARVNKIEIGKTERSALDVLGTQALRGVLLSLSSFPSFSLCGSVGRIERNAARESLKQGINIAAAYE